LNGYVIGSNQFFNIFKAVPGGLFAITGRCDILFFKTPSGLGAGRLKEKNILWNGTTEALPDINQRWSAVTLGLFLGQKQLF